jgi:hypothetical protein
MMRRWFTIAINVAFSALVTSWALADAGHLPFATWKAHSQPSPDLRATLIPLEQADRGHDLRVVIGIKNMSKRPLYFSFRSPDPWFRQYSFKPKEEPREGRLPGLTGVTIGSSDLSGEGREVCHETSGVFMLNPGGEMFRGATINLDQAPEGNVTLTVDFDLVKVTPGMECERARILKARAKADLLIRPTRPPSVGGKVGSTG